MKRCVTATTVEVTIKAVIGAAGHTDAAQIAGGEYHSRQTEGVMIGTKRPVNVEKDEKTERHNGRPRTPAQRARNSPSRAQRA